MSEDLMSKVRKRLILDHPWWGVLSLRLKLEATTDVATAEVDGRTLRYNPEYLESLTAPEQDTLCAHEVSHCALGHPWRLGSRDLETANLAMDHVVNLDLQAAGFTLPQPFIAESRFAGMAFEKVYSILMKERAAEAQAGNPQPGTDKAEGEEPGETEGKPGTQPGKGKGPGKAEAGKPNAVPGPSSQGKSEPSEAKGGETGPGGGKGNPANWGVVTAPPPALEAEEGEKEAIEELEHDWEKAVETASLVAQKAGNMPGNLLRSVEDARQPTEDLTATLQQYLTSKGSYSYASPNKRMLHRDIRLPGRVKSRLEEVVIAVDTSGSINQPLLTMFRDKANEVFLMEDPPERITIIYCDAAVRHTDEFTDGQITFNPVGGGGTLFSPVFKWVEEQGMRPDVLIYLTDLECYDSQLVEPEYPTLWVAPVHATRQAAFGEVVRVDPYH